MLRRKHAVRFLPLISLREFVFGPIGKNLLCIWQKLTPIENEISTKHRIQYQQTNAYSSHCQSGQNFYWISLIIKSCIKSRKNRILMGTFLKISGHVNSSGYKIKNKVERMNIYHLKHQTVGLLTDSYIIEIKWENRQSNFVVYVLHCFFIIATHFYT